MTQWQASDFEKISPTAFAASLCRQFTNIPYAKEFAQLIEIQGLADPSLSQYVGKAFPGIVNLEARYKAISKVIADQTITQVLELASGFLPRGMAMSSNPSITFIESDLQRVIHCKQQLVLQLIEDRPNLYFLEIDATSHPNQLMQSADYFQVEKPVLILCEGLLMHLTLSEKRRVCVNVFEMLLRHGGVWITSDFAFKAGLIQSLQSLKDDPVFAPQIQATLNLTSDDDFQTLEQAEQFICDQGFRLEKHSLLNVMDQLSCLDILNIDTNATRRAIANQFVFTLTLEVELGLK
ncbi:class I SAM-dependent methyltransferase [Nostoc sp.]